MSTVGQRLREGREGRFMTQEQLAEKSGVPVVTISRIENNRQATRPRLRTIQRLAEALEADPAWIMFGGEDLKKPAA